MSRQKQKIVGTSWTDAKGILWQVIELEMPNLYRVIGKRGDRVVRVGSMRAAAIRKVIDEQSKTTSEE